ncbi:MAG: hypothetical protein IIX84_01510 [Oscillospiraceae bacterium]|nr:hypothetical protein [Oscillospiraceae bacterium]
MKKLIPALPLFAALAVLFNIPVFADVVFFPHRLVNTLVAVGIAMFLVTLSVAAVLVIFFVRKAKKKKEGENK